MDFVRRGQKEQILKPANLNKGPVPISVEKSSIFWTCYPYISETLRGFYTDLVPDQDKIDVLPDSDDEKQ